MAIDIYNNSNSYNGYYSYHDYNIYNNIRLIIQYFNYRVSLNSVQSKRLHIAIYYIFIYFAPSSSFYTFSLSFQVNCILYTYLLLGDGRNVNAKYDLPNRLLRLLDLGVGMTNKRVLERKTSCLQFRYIFEWLKETSISTSQKFGVYNNNIMEKRSQKL